MPHLQIAVVMVSLLGGLGPSSQIALNQSTTSDVCGVCHRDIYRAWKSSVHATALEDPVFLSIYREAQQAGEGASVRRCLNCHAPMIELNGDEELREKLTWEGVNCDFCHSLVAVDMSGFGPRVTLDLGATKRGPIEHASSLGHEVAYSELHLSSLACAPCHEYVNTDGVRLMGTYTEWLASNAAEQGRTCQHCHMSETAGEVVDPRLARTPRAMVNLHEMPGGHSITQLNKALSVKIRLDRTGETLEVVVSLENRGAGHAVPTGMPGRRILLQVRVTASDGTAQDAERIYEQAFNHADGTPIRRAIDYFGSGVKPGPDNRIQADEKRVETFRFSLAESIDAQLVTRLHYEHSAEPGDDDRTWLTFFTEKRWVRSKK